MSTYEILRRQINLLVGLVNLRSIFYLNSGLQFNKPDEPEQECDMVVKSWLQMFLRVHKYLKTFHIVLQWVFWEIHTDFRS